VVVTRGRLLAAGVVVATVIACLAAPHAVLSPGSLTAGHAALESDCFACHVAFRGPDGRCGDCHDVAKIDARMAPRPAFHGALADARCSACHTDHRGPEATVRKFRHDLLHADLRQACARCHAAPGDALHAGVEQACSACHSTGGWKPATFAHEEKFRFDRDHPPDCRTCHPERYDAYTCYGCHEHQPAAMLRKHREEGIRDLERCAECHRSAEEKEGGEHGRRGRRERGEHEEDDD